MDPHLEDGRLQALLDDELGETAARSARDHLATCPSCRGRLEGLERLGAAVTARLAVLDRPVSMEAARQGHAAARERRGAARRSHRPGRAHPGWSWRSPLAAAASVLLLVTAGVAASLPGSPIRAWMEGRQSTPDLSPAATLPSVPETTGVFASLRMGTMDVQIRGLAAGGWVEVHLVDGDRAGAFAPAGAAFESGPGRLGVHVEASRNVEPGDAGAGPGVRVELPRGAREATVQAGRQLLLRVTPDGVHVPSGIRVDSTTGVIRIQVPDPAPGSGG
jgi:hypothetical protein